MRLALTDFNKNRIFYRNYMWLQLSQISKNKNRILIFYRNCMWLQLSQISKKFTKGNVRKLAFISARDITKIRKTCVVSRVGIHLGARSGDAMYRMRESKSKLELFYLLFIELFCHILS